MQAASPAETLKSVFFDRLRHNPRYSLRAFARDLNLSHSYLSLVLREKRALAPERAAQLAPLLRLEGEGRSRFLRETSEHYLQQRLSPERQRGARKTKAPRFNLEVDRFKVVSHWYHLAILDLCSVSWFRPEVGLVSRSLGIKRSEVRAAVKRLERLGLLRVEASRWVKTHAHLVVAPERAEASVRRFHKELMAKASQALDDRDPESFASRHVAGCVMAVDSSRLKEARRRIERFRSSLGRYLSAGEPDALYHLGLQLFPLAREKRRRP